MAERYISDGMIPEEGDVERLSTILGRPLHSCREFAVKLTQPEQSLKMALADG